MVSTFGDAQGCDEDDTNMTLPLTEPFMNSKRHLLKVTIFVLPLLIMGCCGCKRDFNKYMACEIGALEGHTNFFSSEGVLRGNWTSNHDPFGAAINVSGINFNQITNVLTHEFGFPRYYCAANERHGPTYVYILTNASVAIFISATTNGAEVTTLKRLRQ